MSLSPRMFGIPQGKRVRREDLHSRSLSPESSTPDVGLEALLRERFEDTYEPQTTNADLQSDTAILEATIEEPKDESKAFDFRLFSTSTRKPSDAVEAHDKTQKIVIKSPSPESGEPGFIQPKRPESYYFTGAPAPERRQQYEEVAISGQEVMNGQDSHYARLSPHPYIIPPQRLTKPQPGWTLPWRVLTIKLHTHTSTARLSTPSDPSPPSARTKKRTGKKRRIIIRKRFALQTAQQRAKAATLADKEAADRAKRTQRNREKKIKKKHRDKAKKAQEAGGGDTQAEDR